MRVFLDANILITATLSPGLTRRLVWWIVNHEEGLTNQYALNEARRNLAKRYPEKLPDLDALADYLMIVNHTVPAPAVELREKDVPILVGAIASGATHLLTRDHHDFGPFFGTSIQGVRILSPAQFINEIPRP